MSQSFTRVGAFAALLVSAAGFVGCQRGAQQMPTMPPPKVTVAKPVVYPVQAYYEYNGHLETTQGVDIRARVKGLLTKVHFTEGTEVAKDTPLYNIDDREYKTAVRKAEAELEKAKADILNWKAQIDLAKAELKRAENTAKMSAAAQTDVDRARATLDVNVAQEKAAVANQNAADAALHTAHILYGYTDIRAPIAGRISRTRVEEGNLVGQSETTMLTTIVRMDELYVHFDAPERDLIEFQRARLQMGSTAQEIPLELGVATEEGYPHRGRIDFQDNRVDTATGTIRIRGRVSNPQVPPSNTRLLYPGLYARIRVPAGGPQPQPVIPEEAIQTGQEGRFVLVLGPGNVVEKRVITVGPVVWKAPPADEPTAPGWVLINPNPAPAAPPAADAKGPAAPPPPTRQPAKSIVAVEKGLTAGDRVVVAGLQKARPGAEVSPDEWNLQSPAK